MTSAGADRRSLELPPPATVRSRVEVPLDLGAGGCTTALVHTFDGLDDPAEHLAIRFGPSLSSGAPEEVPLVRLHSECLTGDVLGSQRCDCGPQLRESVCLLDEVGGYLLYLRQEGRGVGLYAKLDAYVLQDRGLDTFDANLALGYPADGRDYAPAAQMLAALGISRIRLLTNNPDKAAQLDRYGIEIAERLPTGVHVTAANVRYLAAKSVRAQHTIDLPHQP